MTRRLLPLLLALLLCTACGGKTAPPSPSPTATPTATPTPKPLKLAEALTTYLTYPKGGERLADPDVLAKLTLHASAAVDGQFFHAITVTGSIGNYDRLGWADCNRYLIDFSKQPGITDKTGAPLTKLEIIYWPEADCFATLLNGNVDDPFDLLDNANPTDLTGRLLEYFSSSPGSLPTPTKRYEFFDAVRLLADYLAVKGPDTLAVEMIEPQANFDVSGEVNEPWIFDISPTDAEPQMVVIDTVKQTVEPLGDAQIITQSHLPPSGGQLIKPNDQLLAEVYSNGPERFIPTDNGFSLLYDGGLYHLSTKTGAVTCLKRTLASSLVTSDSYPTYRISDSGLLLYDKNGARQYDASGRLLKKVDIPFDDYVKRLSYRYGYSVTYSDDLSLTAISSDQHYTLIFDNKTKLVINTIYAESIDFEPNSTRMRGVDLKYPNADGIPETVAGCFTFDPRSNQPPKLDKTQPKPDKNAPEIDGYYLSFDDERRPITPDEKCTLPHYLNGQKDATATFSADPFNGLAYTLSVDYSGDGYCLLTAKQCSLANNRCLLLLRDGDTTASPVVYSSADTYLMDVSGDGALLLRNSDGTSGYTIVRR